MKTKGCVHIHIKNGKIKSVFSHLSNFPKNGVIHLEPTDELTEKEFEKTHPADVEELRAKSEKIFNMGDDSYKHEE